MLANKDKLKTLVAKYGGIVPRYTSYPTAPEWKQEFNSEVFENAIVRSNKQGEDYSLYLHIPFCESQCYFCGCNVIISKEHGIEDQYLERLKEELKYLGSKVDPKRKVIQMAWGGGTPTYLTPAQIHDLYECIAENFTLCSSLDDSSKEGSRKLKHEYSIEIDPRITSVEHLQVLHKLGFNRLSMGIQDFNLETQEAINRIQSFESIEAITQSAREIGFKSINFDLIYGLPFQNIETFADTVEKVKQIDPDRIALFNYAHIPSMLPFQKKYIDEATLPDAEAKTNIFDMAVQKFTGFGYEFIGIDHFAKPGDELSIAQRNNSIYRNFQGYTTHSGCDLFAAGVTAISDIAGVYKQNYKKLNDYYEDFGADKFLECSEDDVERRNIIKSIMCQYEVTLDLHKYADEIESMTQFVEDALLEIVYLENETKLDLNASRNTENETKLVQIKLSELGRFFVRNVASVFDTYLKRKDGHKVFSKAL